MSAISIFILFLSFALQAASFPAKNCEANADGIMQAHNGILANQQTSEHLQCLLQIHKSSSGITKSLANRALRPLLGGSPLAGRQLDDKTRQAAERLHKNALTAPDVVHESFLTEFAQGTWGFYDLFCKPNHQEFCTLFLPDETQVKKESALLGSSSLILLRTAYLDLKGSDRKLIESRIRNLYFSISKEDALKRKVIEQIYQELFGVKVPLALH